MEPKCTLCQGSGWVDIRIDPVPPWSDFMSVDQDVEPCWLCNPNESVACPEIWPEVGQSTIPYYFATALGGFGGQYGLLQGFDTEGNLTRSFYIDRNDIEFGTWRPDPNHWFGDCPVCHNWGLFSDNGNIQVCIACGGREEQKGYEPLYAFWINWKLGHSRDKLPLYTPRGTGSLDALELARFNDRGVTSCLISAIEEIPGVERVQ